MTVVYKVEVFPDPVLNAVCVTHPSGHWWSQSPGCAPSSPSPVRPAGWCIPSPGSACCAPTGSIYPATHARWPPAAAAACCSPSGFYGDVWPLQTQPAATCWLLPADWDKVTKRFKDQSAVLLHTMFPFVCTFFYGKHCTLNTAFTFLMYVFLQYQLTFYTLTLTANRQNATLSDWPVSAGECSSRWKCENSGFFSSCHPAGLEGCWLHNTEEFFRMTK